MVVERGILGPPGTPNTIQDIRVLNRIISWKDEGIWWEPDSRHADLVVEILESTWTPRKPENFGSTSSWFLHFLKCHEKCLFFQKVAKMFPKQQDVYIFDLERTIWRHKSSNSKAKHVLS